MYDYLIVGAGLAGATFTEHAIRAGKKCLVVDRRNHIAGNCYTENMGGINVHMYGPHLFHTSNKAIWEYVTSFTPFNSYRHTVQGMLTDGRIISLPINLSTFATLFGIETKEGAIAYLRTAVDTSADTTNVEGWCLANIGRELYELLIKQYTIRQWNRQPKDLPASIIKRLPVRTEYNTAYFNDTYQGIPIFGYTELIAAMLKGADVITSCDYLDNPELRKLANRVVYTGSCDELFKFEYGELAYRSVYLTHEVKQGRYLQTVGQYNNLSPIGKHTRSIEHKHFNPVDRPYTIISHEYPTHIGEPYYPINDEVNTTLATRYAELAKDEGYILCGRMANYQYYDMHQVIGQVMSIAKKELNGY